MARLSYFMGDLYPNLGNYNDTTSQTVPLPQDVAAIDQDPSTWSAGQKVPDPNVSGNDMKNHYWGLMIIVATILMLGIRL
jgi:hypothetical protein